MSHSLVVLAGGMARRYGALKQLEAVGPSGEALVDYTIYDALAAGFSDVTFVVRAATEDQFREHLTRFWPDHEFRLAIQSRDGRAVGDSGSWKPWGTAHAVLSGVRDVAGPFAVLNADDFYGAESLRLGAQWLSRGEASSEAALIAFRLGSTLSLHGGVSRAVCSIRRGGARASAEGSAMGELGVLAALTEWVDLVGTGAGISGRPGRASAPGGDGVGAPESGASAGQANGRRGEVRALPPETPVSMNLWALPEGMAERLRVAFERFRLVHERDAEAEYLLPDLIDELVADGRLRVRVLESPARWMGLTYSADRPGVRERLAQLVASGVYPERLGS